MSLIVPNNGEGDSLSAIVAKSAAEDLVLRLFKNNITPSELDVAASYTESDFTGYSSINLVGANWVITEGAPSDASYAEQTITSSADQAEQFAYGYFLTRVTSGRIAWSELFTDGPYSIARNGDVVKIAPKITAD